MLSSRTSVDNARAVAQDPCMRETERRVRLVEQLRTDGRASVAALADDLGVTPSTIRRDLQRLARDGRLVRTYGGAALSPG